MERLTKRYGIAPDGESDVWVKQHDYISAARKLCDYEDLEERLHKIFGEESTFSLADVIDALEMKLSEPDKKHPVNARILTYEETNKWQEYKDLEEQGLLVKLPCKVGDTVYVKLSAYCKTKYAEAQVRDYTYFISCGFCVVVTSEKFDKQSIPFSEFGKSIFLTREEAEKALEEMEK